jgi:Domain of unknown function (DUF4180)
MDNERKIIIAADAGIAISSLESISDAMGQCFGANGLILTDKELSPDFFNLRTGIAGELFQEATNYHLHLAIVLADFEAYGDRFSELVYEHRNHPAIRFFHSQDEAQAWLST